MSRIKRDIQKLIKRIEKSTKMGKEGYLDYFSLVDEVVRTQKWDIFKQALYSKYYIDIENFSIDSAKQFSWREILKSTNTSLNNLKYQLFKSRGVWTQSLNFYLESNSVRLGKIKEIQIQSPGPIYLVQKTIKLEALTELSKVYFDTWDDEISPERNIINLYIEAIDHLIFDNLKFQLFKSKGVFQKPEPWTQELVFYLESDNIKLGKIREIQMPQGQIKLEVFLEPEFYYFDTWDSQISPEKNIINLYDQAIDYLIQNHSGLS